MAESKATFNGTSKPIGAKGMNPSQILALLNALQLPSKVTLDSGSQGNYAGSEVYHDIEGNTTSQTVKLVKQTHKSG